MCFQVFKAVHRVCPPQSIPSAQYLTCLRWSSENWYTAVQLSASIVAPSCHVASLADTDAGCRLCYDFVKHMVCEHLGEVCVTGERLQTGCMIDLPSVAEIDLSCI